MKNKTEGNKINKCIIPYRDISVDVVDCEVELCLYFPNICRDLIHLKLFQEMVHTRLWLGDRQRVNLMWRNGDQNWPQCLLCDEDFDRFWEKAEPNDNGGTSDEVEVNEQKGFNEDEVNEQHGANGGKSDEVEVNEQGGNGGKSDEEEENEHQGSNGVKSDKEPHLYEQQGGNGGVLTTATALDAQNGLVPSGIMVTPDSDVHKTSDDNLSIADLFKRKKGKEKVNATRFIDIDNHEYCSDFDEYPSVKEDRVFDIDRCDTDADYHSGFSSPDYEWSGGDTDTDDEKIPMPEEILRKNVMGYIADGTRCNTKTIRKEILMEDDNVKLPTATVRQVLHSFLVQTHGSYINSFNLVPELCRQIKEKNPGIIAIWSSHPMTKEFEGLCIAYKASLEGFMDGCRPIIALDGSVLDSMYGGTVLTAASIDADNGMYPLAVYICRTEHMKEWDKFLAIIAPYLMDPKTSRPITFIHDFTYGIQSAVEKNFQGVTCFQRLCGRQMLRHIGHFHGNLRSAALKVGKAYNENDHNDALEKLDNRLRRWIETGGRENWARHLYHPSSSCPQMTNILSKAFNKWITDLKCFPICQWVIGFEAKLIRLFRTRRRNGWLWKNKDILPRASKKLKEKLKEQFRNVVELERGQMVDLGQRLCSCGEWQISGIPCVHAMVVLTKNKPPLFKRYVHKCYTVKKYRTSYAGIINPMASMTVWRQETRTIMNPPPLKVPKGPSYKRPRRR
ncbi:uncharacterized protein LOC113325715 [Papaver somniferum]|uniref:uncharacterized protein LOC113325715 n=1 Tax=Papaver somniferum TaxID=3469 RepID=UPI000E702659|nr:uncharacterized protein LOC113325715 [Papaver somniferum]